MDCMYSNYIDEGALFKQAMLDHEQYLVTKQILKDTTGNSYIEAFNKISLDNTFNISETFVAGTRTLEVKNESKDSLIIECRKSLLNTISSFEKGNKLSTIIALMGTQEDVELSSVADEVLQLLNEDDFELKYYKLNAFLIFDEFKFLNNQQSILVKPELDLSNALKISDITEGKVIVNTKEIGLKKLRVVIINYLKKNSENPIISIKN